jgi:hypothetical protein
MITTVEDHPFATSAQSHFSRFEYSFVALHLPKFPPSVLSRASPFQKRACRCDALMLTVSRLLSALTLRLLRTHKTMAIFQNPQSGGALTLGSDGLGQAV